MRRHNLGQLRNDVASFDLNRRTDLALTHREHAPREVGSVSKFGNRFVLLHQWGFLDLCPEFCSDGVKILVIHKLDGDLLGQVIRLLFGFASFNDWPNRFLYFFKRTFSRFLLSIDFDDVNAELRLDEIADRAHTQAKGYLVEFRDHLSMSELSEISAGCRSRVFRKLLGEAAKVFALFRAVQDLSRFVFDFFNFFRRFSRSLEENMLRLHTLRQNVLVFVLLVILA